MAGHDDEIETEVTTEDEFCTLQVRTKRGEGTRDQDRVTATLGRDSLEAIEEDRDEFIQMVKDTAEEARTIQPDAGEEDDA
ncbi:DUF7389 domain-containing protein [Halorubrum tropicale]|uniref:DUF7389 domain-containing protein n=1 Tax=Halorubrum tropicale TaxID=1765655 RepID=A0A0N0BNM4_9EURY|nr:hypothetical protein [Halorubrum tropicale]KOX92704.1 hypothetical protein AMR74_16885 [Halorubrum tropicale]